MNETLIYAQYWQNFFDICAGILTVPAVICGILFLVSIIIYIICRANADMGDSRAVLKISSLLGIAFIVFFLSVQAFYYLETIEWAKISNLSNNRRVK